MAPYIKSRALTHDLQRLRGLRCFLSIAAKEKDGKVVRRRRGNGEKEGQRLQVESASRPIKRTSYVTGDDIQFLPTRALRGLNFGRSPFEEVEGGSVKAEGKERMLRSSCGLKMTLKRIGWSRLQGVDPPPGRDSSSESFNQLQMHSFSADASTKRHASTWRPSTLTSLGTASNFVPTNNIRTYLSAAHTNYWTRHRHLHPRVTPIRTSRARARLRNGSASVLPSALPQARPMD